MPPASTPCIVLLSSLVLLAGCKDRQITTYRAPKDPAPVIQPTSGHNHGLPDGHPPIDGTAQPPSSQAQGLPDGHPPIGGTAQPAGNDMATMANTAVPTAGGADLKWIAPSAWTVKPGSAMRKGSYTITGNGAEADFAITAFPGDTGGLHANLNRWRSQVGLPDATPAQLDAAILHLDARGGLHFDVVDLIGPSGTRMLGAITNYNGNSWFFKMMGPDALVAAEKAAYLEFLQNVQTP